MKVIDLNQRLDIDQNSRLGKRYIQFGKLLDELRDRELPAETVDFINQEVEQLNSISGIEKAFKNQTKLAQSRILKRIEKDTKLVTKNHYRTTWLAIGMAAFGIPMGVVFGTVLGNMAFLGIGLPIGMAIGIAVGTAMDAKASEEGKQLDIEIKL